MIFHTIYSPFYCYILTYVFLVNFTLYFTQHLYAVYILCIPHHYYYNYMMPGSKATDLDTYGLFCATHSHVYATLRSMLNICHLFLITIVPPYQEEADVMFNSALAYELCVLKPIVEPLLFSITEDDPEYQEAKRLLKFLAYFLPCQSGNVPINSIMREFIGGGCFRV